MTDYLGLKTLSDDDYFDAEDFNANFEKIDAAAQSQSTTLETFKAQYVVQMPEMASAIGALKENQGGVSLRVLTKTEYDALESHDSATVYYVTDGNKISQYLGDTKLSAGTAAGNGSATSLAASAAALSGEVGVENVTKEES